MGYQTEKPVLITTLVASGAVSKKRFIKPSGAQCTTKGELAIGVSRDDVDSGKSLEVTIQGTALVLAGEALDVGDQITTNALGKAVVAGRGNYVNGIVMRSQAIPDQDVEIMLGGHVVTTMPTTTTTTSTTTTTTTTTAP